MAVVLVRTRARRDIVETAKYLEIETGIEASNRFVEAARATFENLAAMPKAGALCFFGQRSKPLRRWQVKGFEEWVIFYLPKRDGLEIVRIIHGARDLDRILR